MRILLVALLVAGCYRDSTPPSTPPANKQHAAEQITSDVLAFIPKESDIVVGVDLSRLRSSPLWASQLEPVIMNNGGGDLEKVRSTCGFDPLTAISYLAFGTRKVSSESEGTVVARGIEPRGALECVAKLITHDNETLTHDGDSLVISEKGRGFQVTLSPLGRSAVLGVAGVGANRALATARVQSGTPLRTSPAFIELYNKLDQNASVWFIANGASPTLQSLGSLGVKPRFIDGTLTVSDHYVAVVRVTFATPDEANNVVTMTNSVSAQVRAMVETFDVHAEGPVARFNIVVTSAQAQTILGMVGLAI